MFIHPYAHTHTHTYIFTYQHKSLILLLSIFYFISVRLLTIVLRHKGRKSEHGNVYTKWELKCEKSTTECTSNSE